MTFEQLDNYHNLVKQIATKEEQINNLRKSMGGLKSPSLEGMPHGSGISDKTGNAAIEIADLEERLNYQVMQAKKIKPIVSEFINGIDDDITRLIFKFRVIYGYSWSEVADTLGGYNTKGSVRSRYIAYMKKDEET